jgi:predicted nucleotidyltransferase
LDKEISHIIVEYKQRLEVLGVRVKKIILYGSYAEGRAKKDSDLDLNLENL